MIATFPAAEQRLQHSAGVQEMAADERANGLRAGIKG